jgi:hypothetical protein
MEPSAAGVFCAPCAIATLANPIGHAAVRAVAMSSAAEFFVIIFIGPTSWSDAKQPKRAFEMAPK